MTEVKPERTLRIENGVYYSHDDYAGFWRRLVVDLIDFSLLLFVVVIVTAALVSLKCSGPSFPLGFSISRIWRLTVALMSFSPLRRDASRCSWRMMWHATLAHCALRETLDAARRIHNGNILASALIAAFVLRPFSNLPNLKLPAPNEGLHGNLRG